MYSKYSKFKITKKTVVVLLLFVLLCFAGYKTVRCIGWKQLYDTGVRYSEQEEYRKAVNYLFAAVEHSPRKNKTYTVLEDVFRCYGEYNTTLSSQQIAQASAEVLKLTNRWYTSENYIPFNDKNAVDGLTATSEKFVSADGSCSVYDYDIKGNLIRKSFYAADGEIIKYILNAYDGKENRVITTEYDADSTIQSSWINLYNDSGIRCRTVDFYPSGVIKKIVDYDTNGRKVRSTGYYDSGLCSGVTYYSQNGYYAEGVSFYENGDVYYIGMEYKQDDLNRYVRVSYDDRGYSDAITGDVTPGNRMEVVFYSEYDRVADYHWIFLDTNTYRPQISLYGEKPVWSIEDLLENS